MPPALPLAMADGLGHRATFLLDFSEFFADNGREGKFAMETIIVRAVWDEEAGIWVAEGANLPDGFGLATGAATLEALEAKLPGMVQDLLASDTIPPIEIIAKVRDRAVA
jgi:Domain of unknown function (DUF1902)